MAGYTMIERKEPEFIQFADGETLTGVLTDIERITVGEKKQSAIRYTVRDIDNHNLYCFLGTHVINQRLKREDLGHVIELRCEGDDTSVQREGRAMKRFKILVSDVPYAQAARGNKLEDGTYISDSDIPF